jgi:hypothetical protein
MPGLVFEDDSSQLNLTRGPVEAKRAFDPEIARAVGVAAIAAVAYIVTMSRVPGYWDAPERIIAAIQLGFSHPPGSPFHALAGNGFSLVAGVLPPELALNLFSALCGAAAAGFLYRLVRLFAGGADWVLSALVALATALGAVVWAECLHAEVYALHWLLWTAFLFFFCRWSERRGGGQRDLTMAAFLFALAFSTHAGTALFAPFLPVVVLAKRPEVARNPRGLAWIAAATAIGLSPYLILPLRAGQFDFMGAQHRPDTWDHLLAYISGSQFNSTAFIPNWWPGEMYKRTAHLVLLGIYSMAGFGCAALAIAAHRLIRWGRFAAAMAAGATLFAALRFLPPRREPADGLDIAAHLLLYLWPGVAAGVAARVHRAWIASAVGAAGLFAFYFGSNQTSEFYAMITPLWAFLAMLLAMGLGQAAPEQSRGAMATPGAGARWGRRIVFATASAQIILFPLLSHWGAATRPFDFQFHAEAGTPGWKLNLAKVGVKKSCWRAFDVDQPAEVARLEEALWRFNRRQALLIARWEVQTALEFYHRLEKRLVGTHVVELISERRWYRAGGELFYVENPDAEASGIWPAFQVFYLVGYPPPPEWETPFRLLEIDRFFFDDRWYGLFMAVGRNEAP